MTIVATGEDVFQEDIGVLIVQMMNFVTLDLDDTHILRGGDIIR